MMGVDVETAGSEPALSAAEPVAFTSQGQIAAARNGSTALLYGKRDEFMNVPLYAAPPAPSVAVKALEWEAHNDGWRGCGSIIYDVYPAAEGEGWWSALSMAGYLPFRERCKSPEAAKAAAQADYEARILSALSARVQDVAGTEAIAALKEAEPYVEICHSLMTQKETRTNVWRVLKRVRAAIAAAPAKQEG